jgi:hypothetical protein
MLNVTLTRSITIFEPFHRGLHNAPATVDHILQSLHHSHQDVVFVLEGHVIIEEGGVFLLSLIVLLSQFFEVLFGAHHLHSWASHRRLLALGFVVVPAVHLFLFGCIAAQSRNREFLLINTCKKVSCLCISHENHVAKLCLKGLVFLKPK